MKRKGSILLTIMLVFLLMLSSTVPIHAAVKNKKVTLKNGKTVTAYIIKGAQTVKFSISGSSYKWSSSKPKVATVTKKGAVTVKGVGTTNIVAQKDKNKFTCKLVVESPKISLSKATLYSGKTASLAVSGTKQKITWKSSNTNVATVSSKGLVTAKSEGTATIIATVGNVKSYKCVVTVKKAEKTSNLYVLNTSTKKIHNPWCRSVPKISAQNYAETNESISSLLSKGYSKCRQNGDW